MMHALLAASEPTGLDIFFQHCITGLTNGSLFALIALGYTMVYGIIELVNFAHGDLVMLGAFLSLSLLLGLREYFGLDLVGASPIVVVLGVAGLLLVAACF